MLGMSCDIVAATPPNPAKRIMSNRKVYYWWTFNLCVDFEESCQNMQKFNMLYIIMLFQVELES